MTWLMALFVCASLARPYTIAFAAESFDHGHRKLDALLQAHVQKGLVDYGALRKSEANLRAYLDDLAVVKPREFGHWTEAQQIAFLINLYNAATLQLILDHYPLASIKDIGWLLKGPWDQEFVRLFGKVTTLKYVEHEILRKRYHEPRIHFAIVCAARGCPPLRSEAYTPDRLREQLENQGRVFLGQREKNRVDVTNRILYLSPIFKWFSDDFADEAGGIANFIAPYVSSEEREALRAHRFRIRYTDYDWSLNAQ